MERENQNACGEARPVAFADIQPDPRVQQRERLWPEVIDEYVEAMRRGEQFPLLTVFFDGEVFWLADGYHRYEAYRLLPAALVDCDIRNGSRHAAILFACGANAGHGLPRTITDKRRAVMTLLGNPGWAQWSDREIARQCRVSHHFVAKLRQDDPAPPHTGNVPSMNPKDDPAPSHTGNVPSMNPKDDPAPSHTGNAPDMSRNDRSFLHPRTGKRTMMRTGGIGAAARARRRRKPEDQSPKLNSLSWVLATPEERARFLDATGLVERKNARQADVPAAAEEPSATPPEPASGDFPELLPVLDRRSVAGISPSADPLACTSPAVGEDAANDPTAAAPEGSLSVATVCDGGFGALVKAWDKANQAARVQFDAWRQSAGEFTPDPESTA